ncbi:MAG: DNA polymerase IV [Thiobacillaceae bacterium]
MDPVSRRIAHLDMDAFYASVELLRYPELRGQPVAIGGRRARPPVVGPDGVRRFVRLRDYLGRGVITTSTYEARALGVCSAMGIMKAARLAPDAILLPVDFDTYRHYSRLFKAAAASIAPEIEDRGIDEIYMDLTDLHSDTLALAHRIRQVVSDATGLSCSIGIAPNKLLAKICSDLHKPSGLTILQMQDIPQRIWPLPVSKVNGIGPKATQRLSALGIQSIGDLANADPLELQEQFGRSFGQWLLRVSRGIDNDPLVTCSEPKSISRETTLETDLHPRRDRPTLSVLFTSLCTEVAGDLKRNGYRARTIGIKLRLDDFRTFTRVTTLRAPDDNAEVIRRAAGECLKRVPMTRKIRLLGVRASNLRRGDARAPWTEDTATCQGTLALFADH